MLASLKKNYWRDVWVGGSGVVFSACCGVVLGGKNLSVFLFRWSDESIIA